MSSQSQVLREYLVSLGFQVNKDAQRSFDATLGKTHFNVAGLGKAVVGVTTATLAMVTVFARSMERMYYSSKLAESTVSNLQAVDFAARGIGLGGDQMKGALEGMARAMRTNPGLKGLVESFGIKVTGRDMSDVAVDLVDTLRKMPFYVGSQYAGLFGIDPDTFLLLSQGLEKFKEMAALRKQMAKDAGVDADEAARASIEYGNMFRNLMERVGLLKDAVAIALLKPATRFVEILDTGITRLTRMLTSAQQQAPALEAELKKVNPAGTPAAAATTLAAKMRESIWNWLTTGKAFVSSPGDRKTSGFVGGAAQQVDPAKLFSELESSFGLPPGILDKIWARESNRGDPRFMKSPAGAEGHMGFMPQTAKRFGVDPYDLSSAAKGTARYLKLLLERYNGDEQLAAMAYNAGEGRIDRYLAGQGKPLASETLGYGEAISGRPVILQQQTTIAIQGGPDAAATARAVAGEQNSVNNELGSVLRNQIGAVR